MIFLFNMKNIKKISILIFFIIAVSPIYSENFDFISYFKKKAKQNYNEAVQIRKNLHEIPELCYNEHKTSKFIHKYLKNLGIEVHTGIAKTGIKAILRGNKTTPVIGIRADMDALPINENTGISYASKHKGRMHACGHDIHMTNALITAKLLSRVKDKLQGTVVFIFQPCEEGAPEGLPGGAENMINNGILNNPDIETIIGLHVMPDLPFGTVGFKKGPIMANVTSLFIDIYGKASHGAFPHQGIDSIYASAVAINQFQSLISRIKDPKDPAVLTIGKIKGGVRLNVIAEHVKMEGTLRTFSFELRKKIKDKIEKILQGLSNIYGIKYDFKAVDDAPYVKNDEILTDFFQPLLKKLMGENNVLKVEPMTIAEDFAHYSHQIPSFFFFLGVNGSSALHTPTFLVREEILKIGPAIFSSLAYSYLSKN